jgi:hypothetical protein
MEPFATLARRVRFHSMDGPAHETPQIAPHGPAYALAKADEMWKRADQVANEDDRQAFRALADQWQHLAKVAERPHL